jgi:uncharacterized membrane protein YvlD (DUF360 family)
MVVTLVANVLALRLSAWLIPGVTIDGTAVLDALLVASFGAVFTGLALRLSYRFVVYSLGLVSILINIGAVALTAELVGNLRVASWGDALGVAFIVTLVSILTSLILSLDDESTFTRAIVRRRVRKAGDVQHSDEPGTVFLEIDGCSYGVLQRAMRAGWMPELSAWLGSGHRLERWYTGVSSQTGASQAGLLLGDYDGIVAFRWYDRAQGKIVVTSNPDDAHALEARLSTGNGLLSGGGASRNNIFSGDAAEASITLSTLRDGGGASKVWGPFFQNPNNVLRMILLVLGDIASELSWSIRYRRRNVTPRLKKPWKYPIVRAAVTVVMRDLATDMLINDMVRGIPRMYVTFVGYDEVAHHDGVERPPALEQLRLLDRQFGRIRRAARFAPRPYEFVVLSDHGQSQGATFLQRYGMSLEAYVGELANGASVAAYTRDEESVTQLNAALDGTINVAGDGSSTGAVGNHHAASEFIVMASGSLGLVYLSGGERQLTRTELDEKVPGLVDGLVAHPGIGWALVGIADDDSMVIGRRGSIRVSDGHVEGENPLVGYGRHALEIVRRHATFDNLPDVLVMGCWDEERDEVPAFEELIGSHGGMGGEQGEPFVMFPTRFEWNDDVDVVGADHMHRVLHGWTHGNGGAPSGGVDKVATPS